jgi:hypothetical protein
MDFESKQAALLSCTLDQQEREAQEQSAPKASSKQRAPIIDNGHDDEFDDV